MHPLTALLVFVALTSAQTCYFPNGNVSPDDRSCNPDDAISPCCYKNQACLSNGLCVSDPHDSQLARVHRGTCTQKSWKSGLCSQHCKTDKMGSGAAVYNCNGTNPNSWCCGDGCNCASNFETFSFPEAEFVTLTIISEKFTRPTTIAFSSTPQARASSVATTTTSAAVFTTASDSAPASTATPSPTDEPTKKSSKSTAIGVGVAVPLVLIALIGGIFIFWRRKKTAQAVPHSESTHELAYTGYYPPPPEYTPYAYDTKRAYSTSTSETHFIAELPAPLAPIEMPAEPPLARR